MADLPDARRVLAAVKPDIVFHLAGAVGASPDLELVSSTYQSLLTSSSTCSSAQLKSAAAALC